MQYLGDNRADFKCLPPSQLQKKTQDIYVYIWSQDESNVGENVNFGLQKYMYKITIQYYRILYKNDFEG